MSKIRVTRKELAKFIDERFFAREHADTFSEMIEQIAGKLIRKYKVVRR